MQNLQNAAYQCVRGCNTLKYAHLSLILSAMHMKCEAKLYSTSNTQSLGPSKAHCGGGEGGLPPLMEFNDCSMSEEEAGGS